MGYEQRKGLISQLEELRGSRVLTYVISDRQCLPPLPWFSTKLSSEPQLLLVDLCREIGETERLDLFLYTRGGDTNSVWPLVSLFREHCENFNVIVPFRAHSGGTMICLAADEIIMTDFAELSPIDPTTGNVFNPEEPGNPQGRLGISVEDVSSYFQLSSERAGITGDEQKVEVLKELTRRVHPLALGNVQRVYTQIRRLAEKLLELKLGEKPDKKRSATIIKVLIEEFYSHLHAINRREATELLGDHVRAPSDEEQPIIWSLFDTYAADLKLRENFSLPDYMGKETTRDLGVTAAFIETRERSFKYRTDVRIMQRPQLPANVNVQLPPGAALPLDPWVTRQYDCGVERRGWRQNENDE